jgi:antitoxin MazE
MRRFLMKTTAQKWGNSLAIRVPKRVAEEAGLREKDSVDIEVREGTLVVRPHLRRVYRLEDLLKRITPKNIHHELDFGGPVGREAL